MNPIALDAKPEYLIKINSYPKTLSKTMSTCPDRGHEEGENKYKRRKCLVRIITATMWREIISSTLASGAL